MPAAKAKRPPRVVLLVGTRKGAFVFRANPSRTRWRAEGPHRFGEIVNHVVLDPRDRRTLLCG
ncbi:MAG: glycosyl hydrolase, partial [Deltaproteobacteria bacterium]|nr:glycosyl hydrolase [Deltaproteobacteria bacterium]